MSSIRRRRPWLIGPAVVAWLFAGCSVAASPGSPAPQRSVVAAPVGAASAPPAANVPGDLPPMPAVPYPETQSMGIGTIELTRPVAATAHFWVACEWPTTEGVFYLYPTAATLLGETVEPSIAIDRSRDGSGTVSFWLGRPGLVAPYVATARTTLTTDHNADWTTGSVRFQGLPINPEAWEPGPLPTPKAAFERPLGGDPAAAALDGSAAWRCGERPPTVPTPGPPEPVEPKPSFPFARLPDATIRAGRQAAEGVPGCGVSWEGYGSGGADSCGPSYQVLGEGHAVHARRGDQLRVTLPSGFHFTAWSMAWVEQSTAETWRGAEPPGMHRRSGAAEIDEASLNLTGLPAGDWSVRITWSGTDGKLTVTGQPDYFRVIVD